MHKNLILPLSLLTTLAISPIALLAQEMPDMPGMEHHHHHAEEAASSEQLGEVHFAVSCSASVEVPFERGIALLHSFGYTKAEEQFRAIAKDDPKCAMAHWGIAMTQYQELWGRPGPEALKDGTAEMQKARALETSATTAREKAYIDALGAFYDKAPADFQAGADAYVAGMAKVHAEYPNDVEGAAFYALSLIADVAPDDTSLVKEHKALAVLVPLFREHPGHPGLAHYIIHTCDTPALAQDGLQAAEVYAKIAPSSPHALHMPGHIFARLGMWQEDIASNEASLAASKKAEAAHEPGAAHQMHADEFLIYAYLQTGQDAKAKALTDRMETVGKEMAAMPGMDDMKMDGDLFTNELNAIYLMEMHEWKALEKLRPEANSQTISKFDVPWGNGVAAGHLHDAPAAKAALQEFDAEVASLKGSPYEFLINDSMIKRNELAGWVAYTEDKPGDALAAMQKAAEQQDKLGQGEVDIPADEMVGDLLMLEHKPQQGLAEYKIALKLSPNRLNGLLGAGAAAEALGNKPVAAAYYAQASRNTDGGKSTGREGVAHAVAFTKENAAVARTAVE